MCSYLYIVEICNMQQVSEILQQYQCASRLIILELHKKLKPYLNTMKQNCWYLRKGICNTSGRAIISNIIILKLVLWHYWLDHDNTCPFIITSNNFSVNLHSAWVPVWQWLCLESVHVEDKLAWARNLMIYKIPQLCDMSPKLVTVF